MRATTTASSRHLLVVRSWPAAIASIRAAAVAGYLAAHGRVRTDELAIGRGFLGAIVGALIGMALIAVGVAESKRDSAQLTRARTTRLRLLRGAAADACRGGLRRLQPSARLPLAIRQPARVAIR